MFRNSGIPENDSRDPETELGSVETELGVQRIHDTLEAGLQRILRSLASLHEDDARGAFWPSLAGFGVCFCSQI